jgi:hypothetical protein
MSLTKSNIEIGVFEDADVRPAFAAAMRKAVLPGQGKTVPDCTPPTKNAAAQSLAAQTVAGSGVCTLQNRNSDATGKKVVRRGCTVEFPVIGLPGTRAKVQRVKSGKFQTVLSDAWCDCSHVWVVKT